MTKDVKSPQKIFSKCDDFLSSRENSNHLVDLLSYFNNVPEVTPPCILALEKVFTELLKRKDMRKDKLNTSETELKYVDWLQTCYLDGLIKLRATVYQGQLPAQTQALLSLFKLLATEGKHGIRTVKPRFPLGRFTLILKSLLAGDGDVTELLKRLKEFTVYKDVSGNIWRGLKEAMDGTKVLSERYVTTVLQVIETLPKPTAAKTEIESLTPFTHTLCGAKKGILDQKAVSQSVCQVWQCLSRQKHSPAYQRRLLIVLLEHMMPRILNPIFLTDFLIDAMDQGGAVSVLALQGIFNLIQTHNIDYPDIYTKLYSLLEPSVLSSNFKARFFYLTDVFLMSTHLPERLVAGFVKRLSRLALDAPPQDAVMLLQFLGNLLIRHPVLMEMFNHSVPKTINGDPYNAEEKDPSASGAFMSSLWEVETLQNHLLPSIANAANLIKQSLPSVQWDITQHLETTPQEMFVRETKKRIKMQPNCCLTFERPTSLALPNNECFAQLWNLT